MSRLPEETMMMILLRLPVKTLGQCKCVSKSWRFLISNPFFVKSHLNLTISDPNTNKYSKLFMMYPFYSLDYESPSSFKDIEDDEAIVDLGSPPKEPDLGVEIVGSCNGLICLLYLPDSFILWNPTIKESKELPTPPFSPSYGDLCFRGFGYNSSIDDYKVVRAPRANANPNQFIVEVFSLKAYSWRRIEDIKDSLVIEEGDVGSCLNGALHWLGSRVAGPNKRVIVSLDLGTEEFREIPIPDCDNTNGTISFNTLGMINGCLSLLSNEGRPRNVGIWEMKEYGVNASWTKLIVLPQDDFLICGYLVPICFTSNGDVVIDNDGMSVVRYNHKKKTVRNLKVRSEDVIEWILYVESLISPNGY
ncbi:F-box/kelch-repeat protein At3g06240-like [Rhododendron vialii]|uniref:F-box/kelch-repeat protein At3g06240-like n=1 Tax=Rhododendron vialii TaxID=182163 RepID=UPI00265DD047|nr:F-box/kelch-repeat protein At3g06240-like [Rhododendron vialii]